MHVSKRFILSLLGSIAWWTGVALSITLYLIVAQIVTEKNVATFEHQVNHASLAVQSRVRSYVEVLQGLRALFSTKNDLSRAEFHTYVEQLQPAHHFPGIRSLNFARHVPLAEREAFISEVRNDTSLDPHGYPDFDIKPAGARAEYHVLTYLEPMERGVLGNDMGALEEVAKASAISRDTGQLISSGRLIRIKGKEEIVGVAMRLPLYRSGMPLETVEDRRAAYFGSVGAGFDLDALMHNATPSDVLRVRLFDIGHAAPELLGTSDPDRLLYDSGEVTVTPADGPPEANPDRYFIKRVTMTVGPRVWEAEFSVPRSAVISGFDAYLPSLMLIIGLAGSTLLYGVYYSMLTSRRRAMELAREMTKDLRSSEVNLAQTQQMARLGSWVLNPADGSMSWSAEAHRILGLDRNTLRLGLDDLLARVHEDERDAVRQGLEEALENGVEFQMEHRIVNDDGAIRWVHTIARRSRRTPPVLRGAIRDITERRQTMEALKRSQDLLRELTAYQDRVKEDERKRIAREIHDELGQNLLALRIDVQLLEARTAGTHPRLNRKVREALHQIDATVKTIRNIINNLRPAVLDLGLAAAIEWQVAQFRRRSGIACELIMSDEDLHVDDARATSLFRILQESLTNVIRHANATQVTIELRQEATRLVMRITDNGVGIYPNDRRSNSFGLIGVEERVHALNGEFFIESAPGKGTTLTIHIPIALEDADINRVNSIDSV